MSDLDVIWDSTAVEAARTELDRLEKELQADHQAIVAKRTKMQLLKHEMHTKCEHMFGAPLAGYEHEGGLCVHCGISSVYASSLKRVSDAVKDSYRVTHS